MSALSTHSSAQLLASNWINASVLMLIHMVDELDALALILEGRVGEGLPAAVLTLIFVGRPLGYYCKSDCAWAGSHTHRGDYRVRGRADDRDGATEIIRNIDGGPSRIDSQAPWKNSNGHAGDHRIG